MAAQRGQRGGTARGGLVRHRSRRGHRLLDHRTRILGGLPGGLEGTGGGLVRGQVHLRRHVREGLLQTRGEIGVVLLAGLLSGLRHHGCQPYACLLRVIRGTLLGRVGVGRHRFRGVQHAVPRRAGRGAHAVDAGHGFLLLGGGTVIRLSTLLRIMPANHLRGMRGRAYGCNGNFLTTLPRNSALRSLTGGTHSCRASPVLGRARIGEHTRTTEGGTWPSSSTPP